jgi:hypothetical protein
MEMLCGLRGDRDASSVRNGGAMDVEVLGTVFVLSCPTSHRQFLATDAVQNP